MRPPSVPVVFVDVRDPLVGVFTMDVSRPPDVGETWHLGQEPPHPMAGSWEILSLERIYDQSDPTRSWLRINVDRQHEPV